METTYRLRTARIAILTAIAVLALLIIWCLFLRPTAFREEVYDTAEYEKVLAHYRKHRPTIVSHFPHPIPSDANDARFYFLPHRYRGEANIRLIDAHLSRGKEACIRLSYDTSPEQLAELHETFSAQATMTFKPGEEEIFMCYFEIPSPAQIPRDYEMLILSHDPNHRALTHGVAFNQQINRIMYWANGW